MLTEDRTDKALALIATDALAAPHLLWIECANVLWVKARRGQITAEDARAACAAIASTPIRALDAETLVDDALEIALALDCAAHDCLYLAAALAERCVLVTADAAFAGKAAAHARDAGAVRLLSEGVRSAFRLPPAIAPGPGTEPIVRAAYNERASRRPC